jgi:PleD family two-component response regulator
MSVKALKIASDRKTAARDVPTFLEILPRRINALILDDSTFDRRRLMRDCQKAGLDIAFTEVTTVLETERALDSLDFDLVFVDYRLSGECGLSALHRIYDHPRHRTCATIMIAGDAEIEIAVRAIHSGCADYIEKARIDSRSIRRAVINAVQKSNMRRRIAATEHLNATMTQMIDDFANDCLNDMKPILSRMLGTVREKQESGNIMVDADLAGKLEASCGELWNFLQRIEDCSDRLRNGPELGQRHEVP